MFTVNKHTSNDVLGYFAEAPVCFMTPRVKLRILNYFSHHERSCIVETAVAFINRIMRLSSEDFFQENKTIVRNILLLNSFPETEIMGIIHDNYTLMRPKLNKPKFKGNYVPIKHREGLTKNIKRHLMPLLDNSRMVGIPDRYSSQHFSSTKDIVDLEQRTNLILLLKCQCEKNVIIRHTKYKQRASHIIREFDELNRQNGKCTIVNHKYNKLVTYQCKYYSSMRNIYRMLTYAHKNKLIKTKIETPLFHISKHIVQAKLTEDLLK